MIVVDIEVPALRTRYQCSVEEQAYVGDLIVELVEMICRKEQCSLNKARQELLLWSKRKEGVLQNEWTLEQEGVVNADCLVLT